MRTVVNLGGYTCRSIVTITCLFMVGCGGPTVERTRFCQLPIIDEFANKNADNTCIFIKVDSPHSIRVYVIGDLDDDQQLADLLPVAGASAFPDASSLNTRIPTSLLKAINDSEIFEATDQYWLLDVASEADGKSIAIHAAESLDSRRFYLEYAWHR